jgi:hypothetical protein
MGEHLAIPVVFPSAHATPMLKLPVRFAEKPTYQRFQPSNELTLIQFVCNEYL